MCLRCLGGGKGPEKKNATWRWGEPTCQHHDLKTDLDPCVLSAKWNLGLRIWPVDHDLWPLDWAWPSWPLTLTHVTFDLDPCDPWPPTFLVSLSNEAPNHDFCPGNLDLWPMTLTFRVDLKFIHVHVLTKFHNPRRLGAMVCEIWISVQLQTDIQKAMHMSPPCIRTGGLKNHLVWHWLLEEKIK